MKEATETIDEAVNLLRDAANTLDKVGKYNPRGGRLDVLAAEAEEIAQAIEEET